MELPSNMSSSQKGEIMDQVKQQIAVSIIEKHKSSDEILNISFEIFTTMFFVKLINSRTS